MKHVFIINPTAGKKDCTARMMDMAKALAVRHGLDVECILTKRPGHAMETARSLAERGEPLRIYVCGGDGTANEAANGVAGYEKAAMTCIPVGTGNDFLKIFGTENKGRFTDLKALSEGPQAAMDLIDCNGTLGIDIVCVGLDSRIAVDKDKYNALPLVSGIGAYILALLENVIFKSIAQPTAVDCGDLHFDGETTIVCVCSGRYYGGGFMPVGDNMPDDGLLETLVVRKVSRATFFRLVGRYAQGKYRDYPDLIWYRQGEAVTIKGRKELVAVVDGEALRAREMTIGLSEKKVNFFYPAGLSYEARP